MIIAFCLYKFFPFGGLQRDFLRIAQTVAARGHQVRVYTQSWEGEHPAEFEIVQVPVKSRTNHGRNAEYHAWVQAHLREHPVDRVVGFNKMPGLDVYFAADVCYAEKVAREKGFFYRLTSRYRHYAAFERATFEQGKATQLMMLTEKQIADFQKHYQTEAERFHILPPGIYPDRKYSAQIPDAREIYRQKNGITGQQNLLLQVGSDFTRKGVDRSIIALASLPEALRHNTLLYIVGQDKPRKFEALAEKLGVRSNVHFFSGRNDVAELMAAADLLLHPAYQEAAGIVLLEAIAAGLPVLTSAVCGFAHYIVDANCGVAIEEPWKQEALNDILRKALTQPSLRAAWAENARHYADTQDLYSLPEKAADIITGGLDG
ncbi:glycosyltransferase family 4 protein [Citrobacter rodentium]|uniref:UDP-glucose:(Heptosyl) LPS alpha-1,3-glucosyltransferase n=3 Tax=Citrobacter rodentium TaxID=67825 RepID=D2TIX2_CITRI|nr:glycosyltransferase family 4 protein [Citrobacter rodentium]QBY30474.1 glycosyltransferase family 1 protein [Citrobacter rodentium]UHO32155.1 glycosyltransferase family 4 protein [Citrobacter rodentium NBRC 105723 = DSM 16636]CBG90884.1 UDP-glucose:(heptosyl) LPS alpha-1,3-glucosyltransferase [Citrobacter rodentium ICC168]HAT8013128.1 glycosyltransferase family 1 protein [Citrobacter rodentium NBRC 105723 = DSM 16636]HAT8018270.1 glycosyltransferase family 1 protein [Citrobacter rodentium]